mgnify:CR=1 FL=1
MAAAKPVEPLDEKFPFDRQLGIAAAPLVLINFFTVVDPAGRYVNGTLGVVDDFDAEDGYPMVRTRGGKRILAEPSKWKIDENGKEKTFSGGSYLHPRQVLRELEKAMPADVMVSTDIGNINSVANSYLRFEEPRSFFAPMSFGNCGYALPTIIGAKVAAPDRPAVSYAGDGAWGMSMSEIMTCVRHDIPVTAVVFHNRQWGAEKKNQVDFYNRRFVAGELDSPLYGMFDLVGQVGEAPLADTPVDGEATTDRMKALKTLGDPYTDEDIAKAPKELEGKTEQDALVAQYRRRMASLLH